MSLVDRYIFRQLFVAFLVVLTVLTLVVWMTTALRQLELVTSEGQAFAIFFTVTLLALPMLVTHISPFALFIASLFTLNKLSSDSELIVLAANGLPESRLARPFLLLGLIVTLAGWLMTLIIVPAALHELRLYMTNVRADLIGTIIQPGKFTSIDKGLTFHVRDRSPSGTLLGVFVDDRRDNDDIEMTYLASKGLITRTDTGTFLILENGQIVRRPKGKEFGSIIAFDRYAFNLTSFMGSVTFVSFSPNERSTKELFAPEKIEGADNHFISNARSELHDRFAVPLFSLAFTLIAFSALGKARTTRQSRMQGILLAILSVVLLRIVAFGISALAHREIWAVPFIYLVPAGGIICGAWLGLFAERPLPKALYRWLLPHAAEIRPA